MTNFDDLLAALIISVMPEVERAEVSLDAVVASLMDSAATGRRSSRDTFNNPWGSSTSPSVAARQLRASVNELDLEIAELLPTALARILLRRMKRDHLAAADARLTTNSPPILASDLEAGTGENEGYVRMMMIMRDLAGLKDRTCRRASKEAIQQAARLIARSEQPRICDDVVDWATIRAAGHQLAVCKTDGWWPHFSSDKLAEHWRENEEASLRGLGRTWVTWLPQKVVLDPPQLPRGWQHGVGMEVYPATWDAFPADPFYRSFVRELVPDEHPLYLRSEDQYNPVSPFPQWEDVVSFRKDDPAFDKAFRDAQKEARIMDGYHARHRDRLVELIADGADPEQERDLVLFSWCAFLVDRVIPDMDAWDAWRPWGILFSALKTYMSDRDLSGSGNIVIVWAYFLYARHLRDEVEFPAFIRESFFDWKQMPVSANLYGAVRYLVPRDQLPANQSDQRASQND